MTATRAEPRSSAAAPKARRSLLWPAVVGLLAAAATLAVAEFAAVFVGPGSSPLIAVGGFIIDIVPPGFKDLVIQLFGTADKIVLIASLVLLVAVLAAVAGILDYLRPPWGIVLLAVVSGIAALCVVTRPEATGYDAVPTVVGMLVGVVVLRQPMLKLKAWRAAPAADDAASRRSFLRMAGFYAAAAVVVGVGSRMATAAASAVTAVREAITLPAAASPAEAVPAAGTLDSIQGISSFVTPNADFYRIDTALQVPSVEPADWSLRIYGMVEQEVTITWDELLALPLEEHLVTLSCVSNTVGGDLIGNALWLGYPIRELLARAKPTADADMVLSRSIDGFTASSPLEVLQDEQRAALVAVGMNGEPLPVEHGFPARLVVPGLFGYVSATKWVTELKVTTFADDVAYWSTRGWTEKGPVKTESRIDVLGNGQPLTAGPITVAGVAWAPHTGVAKVEVQIDGGAWNEATLPDLVTTDSWRQWMYQWDASAGDHTVQVRATDESGYTQTSEEAPPAPDGATGWHRRRVTVG